MVRKDCYPDAKPDEEFPFPVQMRMGCYQDEEFQVLQKVQPEQPWLPVRLGQEQQVLRFLQLRP
jgi:hypothetical protein